MASKILITMDDLESAVRLNAALEAAQYRTVMISPMDDGRGALRKEHPDLLVLTGAVHESQAQALVAQAWLARAPGSIGSSCARSPRTDRLA